MRDGGVSRWGRYPMPSLLLVPPVPPLPPLPPLPPVSSGSPATRRSSRYRIAAATPPERRRGRAGTARTSPARTQRCWCRRRRSSRGKDNQTSEIRRILASMRRLALLCLTLAAVAAPLSAQDLFTRVVTRIAKTPNTGVGVYYRRLDRPDSLLVDAAHRFHAASTMKVPVMIQVFCDADAGTLHLSDSLTVVNEFHSIVDGSPFQLDKADDSDSSLNLRVGQKAAVRDLLELMITVSSNLATDILIERIGPARANTTAHSLGADSILVLRGVEDGVAYRAGMNNTTTARDLGMLFTALAQYRAASPAACREMLDILGRQHFTEGIPAGLPPGTRVYHKTGWIGQVVYHDAAVVEPTDGRRYVIVVLTGGIQTDEDSYALVRDLSRLVFDARR